MSHRLKLKVIWEAWVDTDYSTVDADSMVLEDHIAGTRWTVYRK
jgi:hypothetical protein